ncbi:hypothetical protein [Sulfuricaulis sp.]|jgi:hypothetical protein|uniref:hypothetical protein n=1 Tax=Sulfuricaulis sp. TaxID=2003553 RepID=UPI0035598116
MKRTLVSLAILLTAIPPAFAADNIDQINQLIQQQFHLLSEDLTAAASYKGVIPAKPLGITGFDLGLEVSATKVEHKDAWEQASSGSVPSTVYVPKLHLHKGLPLGIDVGAFYSSVPNSDMSLWGAELRYAIMEGGVATPALGLRGTYSKLTGIDNLDFHTTGLELLVSKGFAIFTPYAGIGQVWTTSEPVGITNIKKEEFSQGKYFVGGNINLGLVNFCLEADKTAGENSYSAKLGFRF